MARILAVTLVALLLSGCALWRTCEPATVTVAQRVEVPIEVRQRLPAELRNYRAEPPEALIFVLPSDPLASSALTAEGEKLLRYYVDELRGYVEAIKAWDQPEEEAGGY